MRGHCTKRDYLRGSSHQKNLTWKIATFRVNTGCIFFIIEILCKFFYFLSFLRHVHIFRTFFLLWYIDQSSKANTIQDQIDFIKI